MRLPEICIKRPVFATVMSVILVLIGLVCGKRLPLMEYPKIERPILTVSSEYQGMSAELMELAVTKILEEEFSKVEGVDVISSISQEGSSKITLQFREGRSLDAAASDIRDRISRIKHRFPQDMREPTLKKTTADEAPILWIALSSETRSAEDIADYAKGTLQSEFETLDGVASANIVGGGEYKMHIWLDPLKLAAYGLTPADVSTTINRQNKDRPAGRISAGDREYMVSTASSMITPEEFDKLIITSVDKSQQKETYVRLGDVGRSEFTSQEKMNKILYNGKNSVVLTIVGQSIANPLEVVKVVKKKIAELKDKLPADLKMETALDLTVFIDESIDAVYETIAVATLLVLCVIFAFLGNFKASFIPLVTIPVSLIGACIILYACNFSINVLTLLSLVLAIGLVVDDAIIVLENVHRHIEQGETPMQAALKGSKEISFAVVAMTITLAAVYAPIALSTGITGKYFREFALTLAGAVIISGFVALTLSPMMCSKFLKGHVKDRDPAAIKNWKELWIEKTDFYLNKLDDFYESVLVLAMQYRKTIVGIALGISLIGYILVSGVSFMGYILVSPALTKELAPEQDRGLLALRAISPTGSTMEYISQYMEIMDEELDRLPEVHSRLTITETPNGKGYAVLTDWRERKGKSAAKIVEQTREKFDKIAGVQAKIFPASSPLGGGSGGDDRLQFLVLSSKSYTELRTMTQQLMKALSETKEVKDVLGELGADAKEYVVSINKDKAAALKIDADTIGETLEIMGKGKLASKVKRDGREYDAMVQVEEKYRRKPQDLTDIYVRGERGAMVALSDLITVETKNTAPVINHFQRLKSITLFAKVGEGYSFSDAISRIQEVAKRVLPEGSKIGWEGETKRYFEEEANMYLVFALALAFIYLVLCAQFESFVDPLVIMLSVPLSMVGALLTLQFTGGSINLFSQIGLVTLIGLITKHGILIVDFANAKLEMGHDRMQAVIEASKMRLRPILMTTAAMVLGAIPLALASGAGAELRQQIGWVIVGGMTFGTIFTLLVIPVVYTFVGEHKNFNWKSLLKKFFRIFKFADASS